MKRKYKYTKTTYFLLPLLGIPFYDFNQGNGSFINSYITSEKWDHDKNKIDSPYKILVLLDIRTVDFDVLYHDAFSPPKYLERIVEDGILYILYSFPEEYNHEFSMFVSGKYSKFGNNAKKIISRYVNLTFIDENTGKEVENENWRALFPNEESRRSLEILLDAKIGEEAEILSPPDLNVEIMLTKMF